MISITKKNYEIKPIKKRDRKTVEEFGDMIASFHKRSKINKARKDLAGFLEKNYGLILRKNSHDIYILDENGISYIKKDFDDMFMILSKNLGVPISDTDFTEALSFISNRLEPTPNKVRFANTLYDMEKMEEIIPEEPLFTLIESEYNFNSEAESTILKEFLKTSLEKENKEETERYLKGVFQVVGYLFTSGNRLNVLPIITGISGGGKSVFANILIAIFGQNKVADLKLQEIEKDKHATSSLADKHLNIINDSDASSIKNNSYIKQMTGNDSLQINPKYKTPYVLSKEEVPKSIIVCNNIPNFNRLEPALIERFLIIEFNHKFRGTDNEKPNLLKDILSNSEEIEWFIYESLMAYKEMLDNGENFIFKKSATETRELVDKHQNPINYILNKFIDDVETVSFEKYVYTNYLNKAILHQAEKEGLDIIVDKNGQISPRELINVIRTEFEVGGGAYVTSTYDGKRYYPDLKANDSYWEIIDELKQQESDEEKKEGNSENT